MNPSVLHRRPTNRFTFRQSEQFTDYYPYGQPHPDCINPQLNNRLFGGKELTTALGINEYDFHARTLTLFGAFTAPAPLAGTLTDPQTGENLPIPYNTFVSPYSYCNSDPINFIDPTGMWKLENKEYFLQSSVLCIFPDFQYMDEDEAEAIRNDYEAAKDANMPILLVENVEDLLNAFEENDFLHSFQELTVNSHGLSGCFNIGNEEISMSSDLTRLSDVFKNKTVFLGACLVGSTISGATFTQCLSASAEATIISSEHLIPTKYKYDGGEGLSYGRKSLVGYDRTYIYSSYGSEPTRIIDVVIHKKTGISWFGKF